MKTEQDKNRSDDFENAFSQLMENEGGFSNDKHDLGEKTIFGITIRDYPQVFCTIYQLYKEGNKALALKAAENFYRKEFWNPLYEEIPDSSLAFKIFDLSVNRGKRTAIKILQKVLYYEFGKTIAIDGIFGQITLGAIKGLPSEILYNAYIKRNEESYKKLSTAWRFLKGWLNRLKKRIYI